MTADAINQIQSEWAIKAVQYARAEVCPRYGPDDEPTPYEKGLIQRLAATYRDGYLAACEALRARAEAPAPPAEALEKLRWLKTPDAGGYSPLQRLRAHMAGNRNGKTLVARQALDALMSTALHFDSLQLRAEAPATDTGIPTRLPPMDLRLVKTLVDTMKRIPAPPSWVGYMEQLIAEIEWLRAWVPPPPISPQEPRWSLSDAEVLEGMSTFENGCDFMLHFKADGRVLLGYGCYGVHWNLAQGARYRLSRWLGINGEQKAVSLSPETLRTLKERKPCARCGGFTFEPVRAEALAPESERLIEHMVNRFLAWRLPEDFTPDGGINFTRDFNEHTAYPMKHEPTGTNLFTATQAEVMVRHLLGGDPEGTTTTKTRPIPLPDPLAEAPATSKSEAAYQKPADDMVTKMAEKLTNETPRYSLADRILQWRGQAAQCRADIEAGRTISPYPIEGAQYLQGREFAFDRCADEAELSLTKGAAAPMPDLQQLQEAADFVRREGFGGWATDIEVAIRRIGDQLRVEALAPSPDTGLPVQTFTDTEIATVDRALQIESLSLELRGKVIQTIALSGRRGDHAEPAPSTDDAERRE